MIFLLPVVSSAETSRTDYRLDPELFRRGLIDRGFDQWLERYDREHPPASDLDLLAQQIGRAWLEYRRSPDPAKRAKALETVLDLERDRVESYPDHPMAANWRVRFAADMLNEKFAGPGLIHLLNLDLPSESRKAFGEGLDRIETQLTKAGDFLQGKLKEYERMDNAQLAAVNRQGLPELYQTALVQADFLRAWCLYHRAKLWDGHNSERVKLLYQLSGRLERMEAGGSASGDGSGNLLAAATARMLGQWTKAGEAVRRAEKLLPGRLALFARIEKALLAEAEYQPQQALKIAGQIRQEEHFKDDPTRHNLVALAAMLLEGRTRLKTLSAGEQADPAVRNETWKDLTRFVADQPAYRTMAFPKLLEDIGSQAQEHLADVELFAFADRAMTAGKVPLAQSALERLVSRASCPRELKTAGATILARALEQQGRFNDAVRVLGVAAGEGDESVPYLLSESARVAWLAYRAASNDSNRVQFLEAAKRLLAKVPDSPSADRFKLLMAEEYSRTNEFTEALRWIGQVSPGSDGYLQACAAKVLTLSRRFDHEIRSGGLTTTRPVSAGVVLGDRVAEACGEVLVVASARQPMPEKIESWKLDDAQVQLLGGAILATVNVLSDPAVGQNPRAQQLLSRYRPILNRYEQISKSAVAVRIRSLIQTGGAASLLEAANLAQKLLEQTGRPGDEVMGAVTDVLAAIHRSALDKQVDPPARPDELTALALTLSERAQARIKDLGKISSVLVDQFQILRTAAAVDAGRYDQAENLLKAVTVKSPSPDLDLARARVHLQAGQYLDAVKVSMRLLESVPPSDVRYWHALIVNLRSHLALGSDPGQIRAAVVARQQEFPNLGGPVTKTELEKILDKVAPQNK